jgi:hypothetical protein
MRRKQGGTDPQTCSQTVFEQAIMRGDFPALFSRSGQRKPTQNRKAACDTEVFFKWQTE